MTETELAELSRTWVRLALGGHPPRYISAERSGSDVGLGEPLRGSIVTPTA
ncbi:MAG: hypothetical protein M3N32_05150 [Actinomycetota bacterium]|nr:hypothetical protein [Actinomycetota bacterium]